MRVAHLPLRGNVGGKGMLLDLLTSVEVLLGIGCQMRGIIGQMCGWGERLAEGNVRRVFILQYIFSSAAKHSFGENLSLNMGGKKF